MATKKIRKKSYTRKTKRKPRRKTKRKPRRKTKRKPRRKFRARSGSTQFKKRPIRGIEKQREQSRKN